MLLTWLWLCGGSAVRWGGGGAVEIPPELLLVFSVDHLKHTLVHNIGLTG